jgi:hypothetical protein
MDVRLETGPLVRIGLAAVTTAVVLAALSLTALPWPLLALAGVLAYCAAARGTGAHRSVLGVVA